MPIISIVTPTLNRASFLEHAVGSVVSQAYPRLQHVVVDGGSSDETMEILRRYDHLRVISERDAGVYDALNKGIRLTVGSVIGFVNSDDILCDGALANVGTTFSSSPDVEMVCGTAGVFTETTGGRRVIHRELAEVDSFRLTLKTFLWQTPMLNARFFRKTVLEASGVFDTSYRVEADFDFLLRLARRQVRCAHLPRMVYLYRRHPESLSMGRDRSAFWSERLSILRQHLAESAPADRRILRVWLSWLASNAVAARMRGAPIAIAPLVRAAFEEDPLFLLRLLQYGATHMFGREDS